MNYKIKDLCEITSSRRIFAKEYTNRGIPFFRSQEVIECSLHGSVQPTIFISTERYNELIEKGLGVPSKGDILLSAIGANRGYPWHVNIENFYFKDGNVIWLRNFNKICFSKYLAYFLSTKRIIALLQSSSEHSAQGAITLELIKNIEIELPSYEFQRHIVNTIGSVDDLIENYNNQVTKLFEIGCKKIDIINYNNESELMTSIVNFEKGYEIGSKKYYVDANEQSIHYIRVGDLLNMSDTFVDKEDKLKYCNNDDILVAFDGAPGRNNIGINGAYSTGIYKLICNKKYKGLIYFEINSKINQSIIKDHSQGTTILHASKSIDYLEYAVVDENDLNYFNSLFNQIILIKNKLSLLDNIKNNLLNKYFTNQ